VVRLPAGLKGAGMTFAISGAVEQEIVAVTKVRLFRPSTIVKDCRHEHFHHQKSSTSLLKLIPFSLFII
jgi:hypothetical protein